MERTSHLCGTMAVPPPRCQKRSAHLRGPATLSPWQNWAHQLWPRKGSVPRVHPEHRRRSEMPSEAPGTHSQEWHPKSASSPRSAHPPPWSHLTALTAPGTAGSPPLRLPPERHMRAHLLRASFWASPSCATAPPKAQPRRFLGCGSRGRRHHGIDHLRPTPPSAHPAALVDSEKTLPRPLPAPAPAPATPRRTPLAPAMLPHRLQSQMSVPATLPHRPQTSQPVPAMPPPQRRTSQWVPAHRSPRLPRSPHGALLRPGLQPLSAIGPFQAGQAPWAELRPQPAE
mmetsp:Transcript_80533/g.193169  ORF Transcript_80533/g.193169 Transcript_80533/m.193169 type:complete len:285 (-) Transcript_80533:39-893(-)